MHPRWRWTVSLCLALLAAPLGAQVIYVDADAPGANDGSSWDNAYQDLQSALEVAIAGSVIKVANGTYRPSVPFVKGIPPTVTFALPDRVTLQGGYAGSGFPNPEARSLSPSGSVLSGDLEVGSNCWTVATVASGTVTLDGFTVRDGDNTAGIMKGAGLQIMDATVTVQSCFFTENTVFFEGSAIDMQRGDLTVRDSLFAGNHGYFGNSGGGAIEADGPVVVTDSVFISNGWGVGGGAISAPSVEVLGCVFRFNRAMFGGGAISGDEVLLRHCEFSNCTASGASFIGGRGGAVQAFGTLTAWSCTFEANQAFGSDWDGNMPGEGGAVWCDAEAELQDCTFTDNYAGGSIATGGFGGALYVAGGGYRQGTFEEFLAMRGLREDRPD